MRRLALLTLCVGLLPGGAACKKVESLAFEPATPIVIENDKGATVPKVVGKTSSGESVEIKETIAIAVIPPGIVEVSGERLIPMKNGKAKISAVSGELSATLDLTVRIIDEVRLTCPKVPCTIAVGEQLTLGSQVMGLGTAIDTDITWSTSADTIVGVDKGTITGIGAGTATISVAAAGKMDTLEVTVKPTLEELRLFCAWPPLFVGAKAGTAEAVRDRSCEATVRETTTLWSEVIAGGKPLPEELEWSSSDGSIIVVRGELTPDRAGGAVVIAKLGTTTAEMPVAVLDKKRGAPPCDDSGAKWNAEVEVTLKATLGEKPLQEQAKLRCQGRAGTECAEAAYKEFQRSLPTFGVDVETGQRLFAFFTGETSRRCCCAKQ